MDRILIIGNAGGGKSVLARKLAAKRGLPYHEIDAIAWKPGWVWVPQAEYDAAHAKLIAQESWVLDGLGWTHSLPERFQRATEIVFIDMPLWMHFWLAAERQAAAAQGVVMHPPGGIAEPLPTKSLFRTIAEVDHDWMPEIRALVAAAERRGAIVTRLASVEEIDAFAAQL